MPTFRDYTSREEFVKSLGLWHYDKSLQKSEFTVLTRVEGFYEELQWIKNNLKQIRDTWNDQSINQIENIVGAQDSRHLEIMQGQKNDKLHAGYKLDQPMYRIKQCDSTSVFYKIADALGLEHAHARYHVQFPGEVTVFHTDIYSPAHEFLPKFCHDIVDEKIGHDIGIRRVIIALEDWEFGQCLMFGADVWKQWQAGDVIYWPYGVPHCGANMGFIPRISASITGLATNKFRESI